MRHLALLHVVSRRPPLLFSAALSGLAISVAPQRRVFPTAIVIHKKLLYLLINQFFIVNHRRKICEVMFKSQIISLLVVSKITFEVWKKYEKSMKERVGYNSVWPKKEMVTFWFLLAIRSLLFIVDYPRFFVISTRVRVA